MHSRVRHGIQRTVTKELLEFGVFQLILCKEGNDMATREIMTRTDGSPQSISGYRSMKPANELRNPGKHPSGSHKSDWRKTCPGIGWFSIGLGVSEILAPKQLCKAAGSKTEMDITFAANIGVREIASGVGILSRRRLLMDLVASRRDVMDLACLAAGFASPQAKHRKVIAAMALSPGDGVGRAMREAAQP